MFILTLCYLTFICICLSHPCSSLHCATLLLYASVCPTHAHPYTVLPYFYMHLSVPPMLILTLCYLTFICICLSHPCSSLHCATLLLYASVCPTHAHPYTVLPYFYMHLSVPPMLILTLCYLTFICNCLSHPCSSLHCTTLLSSATVCPTHAHPYIVLPCFHLQLSVSPIVILTLYYLTFICICLSHPCSSLHCATLLSSATVCPTHAHPYTVLPYFHLQLSVSPIVILTLYYLTFICNCLSQPCSSLHCDTLLSSATVCPTHAHPCTMLPYFYMQLSVPTMLILTLYYLTFIYNSVPRMLILTLCYLTFICNCLSHPCSSLHCATLLSSVTVYPTHAHPYTVLPYFHLQLSVPPMLILTLCYLTFICNCLSHP